MLALVLLKDKTSMQIYFNFYFCESITISNLIKICALIKM